MTIGWRRVATALNYNNCAQYNCEQLYLPITASDTVVYSDISQSLHRIHIFIVILVNTFVCLYQPITSQDTFAYRIVKLANHWARHICL